MKPGPLEEKKYYTAFVIGVKDGLTGQMLTLHCTHKYLGYQNTNTMGRVSRIIDNYFSVRRTFPRAVFNERVTLGPLSSLKHALWYKRNNQKPISVLKSFIDKSAFLPDLREQLDVFRVDDFEEYRPHITIDKYPNVSGIFQCYAIMCGQRIIIYWENPEWQQLQRRNKRKLQGSANLKSHPTTD